MAAPIIFLRPVLSYILVTPMLCAISLVILRSKEVMPMGLSLAELGGHEGLVGRSYRDKMEGSMEV